MSRNPVKGFESLYLHIVNFFASRTFYLDVTAFYSRQQLTAEKTPNFF